MKRNKTDPKQPRKKVKRSKKFWQQRKTHTISQVQTDDSEIEDDITPADTHQNEEPSTEYQKLLDTFALENSNSNQKLVSDSESDLEESEDTASEGN